LQARGERLLKSDNNFLLQVNIYEVYCARSNRGAQGKDFGAVGLRIVSRLRGKGKKGR